MITLKTLPNATAQEVFNQVAHHLLTQKVRSVGKDSDGNGGCKYRGDNGTKCAAGCLIADDEYEPAFEDYAWNSLATVQKVVTNEHSALIQTLQQVHDQVDPVIWQQALDERAERFGLTPYYLPKE